MLKAYSFNPLMKRGKVKAEIEVKNAASNEFQSPYEAGQGKRRSPWRKRAVNSSFNPPMKRGKVKGEIMKVIIPGIEEGFNPLMKRGKVKAPWLIPFFRKLACFNPLTKRGKVKAPAYENRGTKTTSNEFQSLMKRGKVKEGGFQGQLSPLFIIRFPPHGVNVLLSTRKNGSFTT